MKAGGRRASHGLGLAQGPLHSLVKAKSGLQRLRGLEKAPPHPGVWAFKGPWVLSFHEVLGWGAKEWRSKPCAEPSGRSCQEEGAGKA